VSRRRVSRRRVSRRVRVSRRRAGIGDSHPRGEPQLSGPGVKGIRDEEAVAET